MQENRYGPMRARPVRSRSFSESNLPDTTNTLHFPQNRVSHPPKRACVMTRFTDSDMPAS